VCFIYFFFLFFLAIYLGKDSFLVEEESVGVQREMLFFYEQRIPDNLWWKNCSPSQFNSKLTFLLGREKILTF